MGLWKRAMESFAVFQFLVMIPLQTVCYLVALFWVLWSPISGVPVLLYVLWYLFIDKSAISGTRKPWARKLKIWRHFCDYFPIKLIKTADLDPKQKYVFGFHPHGVISMGAMGAFGSNGAGFDDMFPGIDLHLLTLGMNFRVPIMREWILSHGACAASRKSCLRIMERGPGTSIMLVVGGAAEALDSHPGKYELTLNRSGFIRVALMSGAKLVPVLAFGEPDIFETVNNPRGSKLRNFQNNFLKKFGFSTPLFFGQGLCTSGLGLMPYRRPITTVVGKPIEVPKWPGKLKELFYGEGKSLVDMYHQEYVSALKILWNEHHANYVPLNADVEFVVHGRTYETDVDEDSDMDEQGYERMSTRRMCLPQSLCGGQEA